MSMKKNKKNADRKLFVFKTRFRIGIACELLCFAMLSVFFFKN